MRQTRTSLLVTAALMTALIAVCAQISMPVPPVPASMSIFAVLLCGALLGPRWGACAVGSYVFMGAIGLPVFAGFHGGPNVLFGPTGGYLIGYILCAGTAGFLARKLPCTVWCLLAAMVLALPLCYVPGMLWMKFITRTDWFSAAVAGVIVFLPGDLIKALLASLLAVRLKKTLALP